MRSTALFFLMAVLIALAPGCALFESGTKAATGAILDGLGGMIDAKLGPFASGVVATAKGVAKEEIKKGTVALIEKSHKAGQWFFIQAMDLAGIRAMDFDADGDGILNPTEVENAKRAGKEKQKKDQEEGNQTPWGWILGTLGLGGAGLGSTWIKSFFRWKDKKLAEKIRNGSGGLPSDSKKK